MLPPGVLPPAALDEVGRELHLQEPPPLHEATPVALENNGGFAEDDRVPGQFALLSALVTTPKSLQTHQAVP